MSKKQEIINWKSSLKKGLNKQYLVILQQLYHQAIVQEKVWDQQCWQLLLQLSNNDVKYKNFQDKPHGFFIKEFYKNFFQPSNSVSSGDVADGNIYQQAEKIMDALNLNSTFFNNIGKKIGAQALVDHLDENLKNRSFHFARGNYGELRVLEGFFTAGELFKKDGKIADVSVVDTDDKKHGDSVRYDILLSITPKGDKDKNAKVSAINLPFEVKAGKQGIKPDYKISFFHLGSISDSAFTFDTQGIYEELVDALQKDFQIYVRSNDFTDGQIQKVLNKMMISVAIQYINWRLSNNFPIFVSDGPKKINLSSEIIKGFMGIGSDPGGSIEYTLRDLFYFVDLGSYNPRYGNERTVTAFNSDLLYTELYQEIPTDNGKITKDWLVSNVSKKRIDTILSRTRITPKFKASIWYGQKK